MPTQTVPGVHHELRSVSAAGGGDSVSTTVATTGLLPNTDYVQLHARNFSTAVVVQFAVNPFLAVLVTTDSGASYTDASENAQDGSASTSVTLSSLSTLANGDAMFVGSHLPFRGVDIDVDGVNSNASVLTVEYWNGTAWTDISDTDGTASGGAAFAQDGTVTWTVPAAWAAEQLHKVLQGEADPFSGTAVQPPNWSAPLFWTRWTVSAALDSAVTLDSMHALNRATAYAEIAADQSYEMAAHYGRGGFGCVEYKSNAGTASLIINVGSNSSKFKS